MLRFEWTAFITDDVVARIAAETAQPVDAVEGLRPLLAQIIGRAGGLPFVETEPSAAARTARGLALLSEAIAHTLVAAGLGHSRLGFITTTVGAGPFARRAVALNRIFVNSAEASEIATLPGMTPALVAELIAVRRRGGAFRDLDELEKRVNGIGPVAAKALAAAVVFDHPRDSRRTALDNGGDLGANLRTLVALQPEPGGFAGLRRALEMALTVCATTPHPATRDLEVRRPDAPAVPPAGVATEWVGELWSDDYWKAMPDLFAGAKQSIDVCMFHIAAGAPTHPTFRLLESLREAHARGVAARVLVDSDNKTDPYHSTIINGRAKRFLKEAGIDCRSDSTFRLLHSKYVVVDGSLSVVGSHNWSSGSYFGFDDLTLAVSSTEIAAQLTARFEHLWSTAT